jgi:hypothetical protein
VTLPRYISRGGEICYNAPTYLEGTALFGFVIAGSYGALQTVADRYLNEPSDGRFGFKPLTDLVLINFLRVPHIESLDSVDSHTGSMSYREVGIWIFLDSALGVQVFTPYMWVNEGAPLVAGREIYGFPKVPGEIDLPAPDEPIDALELHATGIEHFAEDSRARRLKLVSVRPPQRAAPAASCSDARWIADGPRALRDVVTALPPPPDVPGTLGQAPRRAQRAEGERSQSSLAGIARRTGLPGSLGRLLSDAVAGQVGFVFLKQFRDIEHPDRACYQAVTESRTQVREFRRGGLLPRGGDWRVELADVDSAPFVRELGIPLDPLARERTARPRPLAAFWMEFSFEYALGRELYRSRAES